MGKLELWNYQYEKEDDEVNRLLKNMHYLDCSYKDLLKEYYFLEICNSVLINKIITKSEVEEIYGHEINYEDYDRKMRLVSKYIKSKERVI